LVVAILLHF